jgi:hypothetical protein
VGAMTDAPGWFAVALALLGFLLTIIDQRSGRWARVASRVGGVLCVVALALLLTGCQEGGGGGEPEARPLPVRTNFREGLLHSYYGDADGQMAETCQHVNAVWLWAWNGIMVHRIQEAEECGVTNVVLGTWDAFEPDAEKRLRNRFDAFREQGILDLIYALTPVDEPDGDGNKSAEQLRAWAEMARRVMADYPELSRTKLAVIYSPKARPAIEVFDLVGWDDYEAGYGVLGAQLAEFKALLRPDQGIILIPGGADGVGRIDPGPFFNVAQADPQVKMIVSFIWFDGWDNRGTRGIRSNGMAKVYCEMGRRIKFPIAEPSFHVCP